MSPNPRPRAEEEAHVRDVLEALGGSEEQFERSRRKPVSIESEPLPVRVAAQTPGYHIELEEPPVVLEAVAEPEPELEAAPKPRRRRAAKPLEERAVVDDSPPKAAGAEADLAKPRRPKVVRVPSLDARRDQLARARSRFRRDERTEDDADGKDDQVLSAEQRSRVELYTMKDSSSRQ